MSDPFLDAAKAVRSAEDRERERQVGASQLIVESRSPGGKLVGRLSRQPAPEPWVELSRGLPALQETLSNPELAEAVAKDVKQLGLVERILGGSWGMLSGGIGDAVKRGTLNDRLAEIGYRQSLGQATAEELAEAERLEGLSASIPRPQVGVVATGLRAAAESAPLMLGSAAEAGHETSVGAWAGAAAGALAGAPAGGVGAIPGAGAGLVSGAGIGLRVGMTKAMAQREKGLAYREHIPANAQPLEPADGAAAPWVTEVAIEGGASLVFEEPEGYYGKGVRYDHVLGQIEAARARGSKALLLSIDSGGGSGWAGRFLYHRLRLFSANHGKVVAFVAGQAFSTAALYALGADYVVMHQRASVAFHAPALNDLAHPRGAEFLAMVRRLNAETLAARTFVPPDAAPRFFENPDAAAFGAEWAQLFGFADEIGGRQRAREVAARLARGERVASPRQEVLAERAHPSAEAEFEVAERAIAAFFTENSDVHG